MEERSMHSILCELFAQSVPVRLERRSAESLRGGEDSYVMLATLTPVVAQVDDSLVGPLVYVAADNEFVPAPGSSSTHELDQDAVFHGNAVRAVKFIDPFTALNLAVNSDVDGLEDFKSALGKYPAMRSLIVAQANSLRNEEFRDRFRPLFSHLMSQAVDDAN